MGTRSSLVQAIIVQNITMMLNIIGIGRERLQMVKSGNPYSARGLWTCQM